MSRIVIIDNCDDCPFFDNENDWHLDECQKLDRKIPNVAELYPIPEDCPLRKTEEEPDHL